MKEKWPAVAISRRSTGARVRRASARNRARSGGVTRSWPPAQNWIGTVTAASAPGPRKKSVGGAKRASRWKPRRARRSSVSPARGVAVAPASARRNVAPRERPAPQRRASGGQRRARAETGAGRGGRRRRRGGGRAPPKASRAGTGGRQSVEMRGDHPEAPVGEGLEQARVATGVPAAAGREDEASARGPGPQDGRVEAAVLLLEPGRHGACRLRIVRGPSWRGGGPGAGAGRPSRRTPTSPASPARCGCRRRRRPGARRGSRSRPRPGGHRPRPSG